MTTDDQPADHPTPLRSPVPTPLEAWRVYRNGRRVSLEREHLLERCHSAADHHWHLWETNDRWCVGFVCCWCDRHERFTEHMGYEPCSRRDLRLRRLVVATITASATLAILLTPSTWRRP